MDPSYGNTSQVMADILRETDPQVRERRMAAELERLDQELDQARRQLDQMGARLAEKDDLIRMNPETRLPIYREFLNVTERLLERRQGDSPVPFAIVQIRLDGAYQRIKNTKDRSHALLFMTTIRIREEIGDSLYQSDRLDEFFWIAKDFGTVADLRRKLGSLCREVARPHETLKETFVFGCQIGYAIYPEDGITSSELLMNAEIALRYGVRRKKPVIAFSRLLGEAFHRVSRMEQELRQATQNGFEDFHLVYQPFVDAGHVIRGCESLIRWHHPELGFIPPSRFIPIAERTGDILFFGRWILYKSCLQLREWERSGHEGLFVSVNLSPLQFIQKDLVSQVSAVLESTGVKAANLKLEITEGAIMEDPDDAVAKLNLLRALGIRISIDDFGTGYSSLNYLQKLPIDTLKIDKSFIDDVTSNVQNHQIVRAIISLARSLDIETLAEGVETEAQKDLILGEGCKYIQGYYFSKPVDPARFGSYLAGGATLPFVDAV